MKNIFIRIILISVILFMVFLSSAIAQVDARQIRNDSINSKEKESVSNRSGSYSSSGSAQNKVDINRYIPSPEAYSIMQYSEFPVSLYNGTADITIPIYTIEVGNWQLPISLRYNTSGIKVAQEASRVGLGWSLNAGGVISRVIRDLDDFSWGFNQPSSPGQGPSEFDGEPDVFCYNFGTYSGKFYAKRERGRFLSANTPLIGSNPEDNLRFSYKGNDVFQIITPDSTVYTFNSVEKTQIHTVVGEKDGKVLMIDEIVVSDSGENMDNFTDDFYIPVGLSTNTMRNTSWYLTTIKYPTGDEITFTYTMLQDSYLSPVRKNYTTYYHLNDSIYADLYWFTGQQNIIAFYPKPTTTISLEVIHQQPELSKIQWKNGELRFVRNSLMRRDIRPYSNSNGNGNFAYPLEKIQLLNKSEEVIQTHQLYHSYFSGMNGAPLTNDNVSYLYARLKLDSISVQGTGSGKLWYKMSYEQSDCLPKKNTLYTDRWGYYPGIKSTAEPLGSFVAQAPVYAYKKVCYMYQDTNPTTEFLGLREDPRVIFVRKGQEISSDCDIPESSDASKTWSLTELTTPTGGKTEYYYESNRIPSGRIIFEKTDSLPVISFTKDYWDEHHQDKLLQRDTIVSCPFNKGYVEVTCLYDGGSMYYETETPIITISGTTLQQIGIPAGLHNSGNSAHEQYTFKVCGYFYSAGDKTITLRQAPDDFARLQTEIKFYAGDYQDDPLRIGGIRIKKVKTPISTTNYRYKDENNKDSGKITRNATSSAVCRNLLYSTGGVQIALMTYIVFNTSPHQPLENPYSGNFMGYSSVYTEKEDSAGVQVDLYKFKNVDEPMVGVMEVGSSVPLNGKLLQHKTFSNGDVVFEENYEYMTDKIDSIIADNGTKQGYIHTYPTYSCFNKLIQKNTWEYGISPTSGQSPVSRLETYFYHPQIFLPNRIQTLYGGQHEQRHEIKYSIDYPNYQDGWFANHQLKCIPVEESFFRDNVLTKRLLYLHNKVKYPHVWKEYVYNSTTTDSIPTFNGNISQNLGIPNIEYAYNNYGRIIRTLDRGRQSNIIIWGYKSQYPIAFIRNASYTDMTNAGVNLNAIANRTEPSASDWTLLYSLQTILPNAEVTICEYEPLVGMIKMTAPDGQVTKYTYDDFLRLKEVREVYNNQEFIRQRYDYKYSNETE